MENLKTKIAKIETTEELASYYEAIINQNLEKGVELICTMAIEEELENRDAENYEAWMQAQDEDITLLNKPTLFFN
jgi:hypothetical protein